MQSVASETKAHAIKPPAAHSRPPAAPDHRTTTSPFESLIPDDPAQSAAPPPQQTNATRTEQAQPAKPARAQDPVATDGKPVKRDAPNEAGQSATTEQPGTADQADPANQSKFAGLAPVTEKTGDTTKTDDKTTDSRSGDQTQTDSSPIDAACDAQTAAADLLTLPNPDKPSGLAVALSHGPVAVEAHPAPSEQPTHTGKADVTVAELAPAVASNSVPATVAVAAAATEKPIPKTSSAGKADAVTVDAAKGKADALLPAQVDDAKSTIDPQVPEQDPNSAQGNGKPHVAIADADKQAIAQARGETTANTHHGSTPDVAQPAANESGALATSRPGGDVAQTLVSGAPPQHTAAPNSVQTLAQSVPAAPVPLNGVAIAIAGKALEGKNRFEIRLDPPELGRIEVRLDVDKDGSVTSHLVAHRAETLDLLRRDAAGLQRALEDAGLKTADNGLHFSLHDQSADQQQTGGNSHAAQLIIPDETLDPIEPLSNDYAQLARLRGGLDIRV